MTRALITLANRTMRDKAIHWIKNLPTGTRVVFHEPKRSIPQNDALWAALGDIAKQKTHHGMKLADADWKLLFMDALNGDLKMVPNLDGSGYVPLGRSSSALSVREMSDLLEIVHAWGAQNGVTFREPATLSKQSPSSTARAPTLPNKRVGEVAA